MFSAVTFSPITLRLRLGWALALTCGGMQAHARTWTDVSGRTVEAEILGVEQDKVVVQMAGRARGAIPMATLSANDQAWVKTWAEGK